MIRLGDYELEEEIGRGGMGRVYRARHLPTGAVRALKVIAGANDPVAVARFRREAEALARVGSKVAVPVHEAGHEGGRTYYVMDLLEGGSLAARIEKGALPWREAVALVVKIARAVARCHERGVIHRDLKPANVLFDEAAEPRLVDFGCARDLAASTLTQTGSVLGTPAYMAPEQLDGHRADERSDVYALGIILHELVTGVRPHPGSSWRELLLRAQRGLPAPVAAKVGAPLSLDRVLERALEPFPARRMASAAELVSELEAVLSGAAVPRFPRRLVAALALVLLVGGGGVALCLACGRRESELPPAPGKLAAPPTLDETTRRHFREGMGTAPELGALVRAPGGSLFLRELVEHAVVYSSPVACAASEAEKESRELALLAAIATLVSSTDEGARAPARATIAGSKLGGDFARFRDAIEAARRVRVETEHLRRPAMRGRVADLDALERAFKPLVHRPDLVAAAALELEEGSGIDVLATGTVAVKPLSDVFPRTPCLWSVLEALPPHVVVARASFLAREDHAALWEGSEELRVRVARALERAARTIEAKEPLLAGHAFVLAYNLGDHAAGFATLEEDAGRAEALLGPFTERDDQETLLALDRLGRLEMWRTTDVVTSVEHRADPRAELARGEPLAARAAQLLGRLWTRIRNGATYDEAELAPAGEVEHMHALIRLALGEDATGVDLVPDDGLRLVGREPVDGAEIETLSRAILADRRGKLDVVVRSASCFLEHCLRSSGRQEEASAVEASRKDLGGNEQLDWLEAYVAEKRIP
ncbi:MAG TPA: serine/threonine-protein kinase [Planctomycetota bacterium]|nr:serine/threonine-protein kinase [Planctomycetota bacterium]